MEKFAGIPRKEIADGDRRFVNALARGLDVLRAFDSGDRFLGNQEISDRTGLPKSSVSRISFTLTRLGYLSYSERLEKYQLGSGVLALGYAFFSNLAIRQVSRPLMQELADSTGTGVGLADRDRLNMIYIGYSAPANVSTFRHAIGDRVPMATNSIGRAFLAALPDEEREYFLGYIRRQYADNWSEIKAGIDESVESYRNRGFCMSWGAWDRDVNGVSVPLEIGDGNIYAFNAGGPAFRLSTEYLENEVAPLLKHMVRNIEATLVRY